MTARVLSIGTYDHDGDIPHLVATGAASIASEALDSGDPYAFTSTETGAFACNRGLHPHEQGQIDPID